MGADSTEVKKNKWFRRPFSVNPFLEWTATILLVLIILTGIAGLIFPISHPVLEQKINGYLQSCGADSCRVGKVTVKIWQGIEVSDIHIFKQIGSQEKYLFTAEKISVDVNLLALLGNKKIRGLQVNRMKNLFYEIYREPKHYLREWFRFLNQYKSFNGLCIIEPHIRIAGFDSVDIEINTGVVDISNDCDNGEMNVLYQVGTSKINGLLFEYNKGTLVIDEKNLKIVKCRGRYLNGMYKIAGDVDVFKSRIRSLQIGATGLQMSSLYPGLDASSSGKLDGDIKFDVKLEPSQFHYDSLRGNGTLLIEDAVITGTSFQKTLKNLIMCSLMDTLRFEKIKNEFDLRKNRTFFNKTHGTGNDYDFSARGWMQPDGSLSQNIEAVLDVNFVRRLAPLVAHSLIEGEKGKRVFRCKVYGNSASPRVELDSIVLKKAIGSVFDDMKENFKYLFRKKNPGE